MRFSLTILGTEVLSLDFSRESESQDHDEYVHNNGVLLEFPDGTEDEDIEDAIPFGFAA